MRTVYFGSTARDFMRATDIIRETFLGRGGDDVFQFFDGSFTEPQDFSDRFIGGTGDDILNGLNVGLADHDRYALLSFDGGDGYDTIEYQVTDAIKESETGTMDLSLFNTLERSVEHHVFDISLTVEESSVFELTGSDGDESVMLSWANKATIDLDKVVCAKVDLGNGNDRFTFAGNWDMATSLRVNTGAGDDFVNVNDNNRINSKLTKTVLATGTGNDTVVLEGMHRETVSLGGGDDTVFLLTGGFANRPDIVFTGAGADRICAELDEYSTLALIRDFDAANDVIVFETTEYRDTTVTFDADEAAASEEPMLYMDNDADILYFGDNVMLEFLTDVELTQANFTTDVFVF